VTEEAQRSALWGRAEGSAAPKRLPFPYGPGPGLHPPNSFPAASPGCRSRQLRLITSDRVTSRPRPGEPPKVSCDASIRLRHHHTAAAWDTDREERVTKAGRDLPGQRSERRGWQLQSRASVYRARGPPAARAHRATDSSPASPGRGRRTAPRLLGGGSGGGRVGGRQAVVTAYRSCPLAEVSRMPGDRSVVGLAVEICDSDSYWLWQPP
jgi:hypothetical protein